MAVTSVMEIGSPLPQFGGVTMKNQEVIDTEEFQEKARLMAEARAYFQAEASGEGPGLLQVSFPYTASVSEKTCYLLVLDCSGSMAGRPWTTVKETVRLIEHERAETGQLADLTYIVYNHLATVKSPEEVLRMEATGGTDFCTAFTLIEACIKEKLSSAQPAQSFVITFLTDGQHGCASDSVGGALALRRFLQDDARLRREKAATSDVVVHTVGFSEGHAIGLLETLRKSGGKEGVYRYADSSGYGSLSEKLSELLQFASSSAATCLSYGRGPVPATAHFSRQQASIEVWVEDAATCPIEEVSVALFQGGAPVAVEKREADTLYDLKKMERELAGVEHCHLAALQERLSAVNPFNLPSSLRQEAAEVRAAIQAQLDALHRAHADSSRSSGAAAMLADLRYAAVFSKARRQRAMDIRAAKNARALEDVAARLASYTVPMGAFDGVDLELFTCDVSQMSARELVEQAEEEGGRDVLGLGFSVAQRSEHVVDAPSDLQIADFSMTFCSWATFEQALNADLVVERVHGGFELASASARNNNNNYDRSTATAAHRPAGEALKGRAREPINAWLPLFVCDAHFELVKLQLRPILGYLFTLDPLGYKDDQVAALYTILGHMHARFHVPLGRRQLADANGKGKQELDRKQVILQDFTRLCNRLLPDVIARLGHNLRERFVAHSGEGRTKAAVSNLMTVVGWAAAEGDADVIESIKQPLFEEAVRRQLANHFHGAPKAAVWDIIRRLLYGGGATGGARRLTGGGGSTEAGLQAAGSADGAYVKRSRAVEKAFADFAQHAVGLVKRARPCPEFEAAPPPSAGAPGTGTATGARPGGAFSPSYWDDDVEAAVQPLKAAIDLTYLKSAVDLSDLRRGRMVQKAVLVSALMHYTNALATDGVVAGTFYLVSDDPAAPLRLAHAELEKQRQAEAAAAERTRQAVHRAGLIVYSADMWAFCGRLMAACPTRGGEVWDHTLEMLRRPPKKPLPHHEEKVRVIVLGRYTVQALSEEGGEDPVEYPIIAGGAAWNLPESDRQLFRRTLSEEAVDALLCQLAGRTTRHVYRGFPGDIPNRHDYCNSRPSAWALGLGS
eukprot:jgi/Mesen1/445/ME000101S10672